ncbi:MAG: alpha/beta hydrolase [Planctomycetota bacterium]|nr:alpha/beta hydrolase [Planctomycetota bacterium]MDP6988307.1 alpha/beta hydrolase [Planctomycetota bacterium]
MAEGGEKDGAWLACLIGGALSSCATTGEVLVSPILERVTHGTCENGSVRLHYASLGEGPLVVMLHGFPDWWYTWRHQMEALAADHRVVALDMRGYNLSDSPAGVESYAIDVLTGDVLALLDELGSERAVIVGHDWGGAVAWSFAIQHPERTAGLVVCNMPHPGCLQREFSRAGSGQFEAGQYARDFQAEGAHEALSAEKLASWVTDPEARALTIEAFERSDFEAMLHYYKANYPRPDSPPVFPDDPRSLPAAARVAASVLMIFGLEDTALLPSTLNDTWRWLAGDLTLVTIPGAGHFVQQDAADLVSRSIAAWLAR